METGQDIVTFYLFEFDSGIFVEQKIKIDNLDFKYDAKYKISELIISDLNNDAMLDLIVMVLDTSSQETAQDLVMIYYGVSTFNFTLKRELKYNHGVFLTDLSGSNSKNLIYFNEEENIRKLLVFSQEVTEESFKDYLDPSCELSNPKVFELPISKLHSSATVDIDGDCLADLLILSDSPNDNLFPRTLEIWTGKVVDNKLKYCLGATNIVKLPPELQCFSVSDIDRNGMLDIVFPVNSSIPRVLILVNKIIFEQNKNWDEDYCNVNSYNKKNNELFTRVFDVDPSTDLLSKNTDRYFTVNLYSEANQRFYSDSLTPAAVRVEDINSDSYPDLTFVLTDGNVSTAYIFLNCGNQEFKEKCKVDEFKVTVSAPVYSSFFDLDDNGQLDLIVVSLGKDGIYRVSAIYNEMELDSFFLKSITTYSKSKYSTLSLGTSYRYIVTNIDGERRKNVAYQVSQTSGLSLSLPFCYMGIGRSNNYIENFVIATATFTDKPNYIVYSPIIPNSQLLISENKGVDKVLSWEVELIVNPISKLAYLIFVISFILLVILVIICVLHRQELKEDQENENLHFIQWFN